MTVFYEKLGLFGLLSQAATRKRTFYLHKALPARMGMWLFSCFGLELKWITKLELGDILVATDARSTAYKTAESELHKIEATRWKSRISQVLKIDFELILNKYFFDELYAKYFFLELAFRYVAEHPRENFRLVLQSTFLNPYCTRLENAPGIRILIKRPLGGMLFYCALPLIPVLLMYHWYRYGTKESLCFNNEIICAVDEERTYEMFSNIFGVSPSIKFVTAKHYESEFSRKRLKELEIKTLGFTKEAYRQYWRILPRYISATLSCRAELAVYGGLAFQIFHVVLLAAAQTVHGRRNAFLAFEHMSTVKAIRNENLRRGDNVSIFVPKSSYVTYQEFYAEIFINYDVMCSPGRHAEDLYARKRAYTRTFLRSGTYDAHRGSMDEGNLSGRLGKLRALLVPGSKVITMLSTGICEETYSQEFRLMELICQLAKSDDITVLIRLKPVPRIAKYHDFYEAFITGYKNIHITGTEYDLFDFIDISDLFVTAVSTSACDIAMRGGRVIFVDYMKTPNLYLPWEKVPDIVLSEESAYVEIKALIAGTSEEVVAKHTKAMNDFTDYVGYRFPDFEAYKNNLVGQLQPFLYNQPANV